MFRAKNQLFFKNPSWKRWLLLSGIFLILHCFYRTTSLRKITYTNSHSLSLSYILSLIFPHTHTLSLSLTHTITQWSSYTHTYTHTHSLSFAHSFTQWSSCIFVNILQIKQNLCLPQKSILLGKPKAENILKLLGFTF